MDEETYYKEMIKLQEDMRNFQKDYYNKLESQQKLYVLLLAGIGLLMTLLKFWS